MQTRLHVVTAATVPLLAQGAATKARSIFGLSPVSAAVFARQSGGGRRLIR
jgi:hypothetical protein